MAGREVEFLRRLYDRFNARDIDAALASLHDDVLWANGWEGGHICGHDEVRRYWTRQWESIDPHVEPTGFSTGAEGEIVAEIHQTVRDLGGRLLSDKIVQHVFRLEDGRIKRFDIPATTG